MNNEELELRNMKICSIHSDLGSPLQLTPTGKVSHAKTRVYAQRYRKAWEQMPDFKGWLTSVPGQQTRAYCTYCSKDLHAHRLSLLKHTCTMKHQRGALTHQNELKVQLAADNKLKNEDEENHKVQTKKEMKMEFKLETEDLDEDVEGFEYVIERLDDDLTEEEAASVEVAGKQDNNDEEEEEEEEEVMEVEEHEEEEEVENTPVIKKMKLEKRGEKGHPVDALAEAMAHVHGEYLDENGSPLNIDLDMVVESVEPNNQAYDHETDENQIAVEILDNEDNFTDYKPKREKGTPITPQDHVGTTSKRKSSLGAESSEGVSEVDQVVRRTRRTPMQSVPARRDYLTRSSMPRSIPASPAMSGSNVAGIPTKTVTLTGGKIMTFDASNMTTYRPGSRYVLNAEKEDPLEQGATEKSNQILRSTDRQSKIGKLQQKPEQETEEIAATAVTTISALGTSPSTAKKQIILKSVKPLVPAKKTCISTHVLDTSKGLPVGALQISLYKLMDGRWTFLSESSTTADGRCADLVDTVKCPFTAGRYKLHFDVDKYFTLRRIETLYPFIEIIFDVKNPAEHYHVPVLISPFGYTTYRGS